MKQKVTNIPQVLTFAQVTRDGKVSLKKVVKTHLGGDAFFFDIQDEVLLTNQAGESTEPVEVRGGRMLLSENVLQVLSIEPGTLLAMIQRENAVALKTIVVEERASDHAYLTDVETPYTLTRMVHTTPLPDKLLPLLKSQHAGTRLHYDVRAFFRGRETLPAWQARQLLGCVDEGDDVLRERFIAERLSPQADNGSWDNHILLTARNVRELNDLGLTQDHAAIQRAVAWLMARPQSVHNLGQWFGCDDLVAEQAAVVESRQQGKGGRFRKIKTSEKKRVIAGDSLIEKPCGPRIMWPNGVVLQALLQLGYEDHPRVQTVLRTLTTNDWCECAYQHGLSDWRHKEPLTEEQLAAFENDCIAQYRYGGFRKLDWLTSNDAPQRIAQESRLSGKSWASYVLQMPDHIQGCEFITTRSLSQVQHPAAQRFAEAHLWRFSGIQCQDGTFPEERYGSGFSQIGILEAIARYDHPAAHVILMRALPWIVAAQNADGSWGKEERKDVETLAVLRTLIAIPIALL